MINFNGKILSDPNLLAGNRAFLYGDGVFETLKILDGKILFFEDHYFRLMAAMRIVRMEIPMAFTLEFLEQEILDLARAENLSASARVRFTVYRNDGGFYLPKTNEIGYLISVSALEKPMYEIEEKPYEVELFKDFYVTRQLLSSVKSTNKLLNTTASIFADENGYDNCLLMNDSKNVIEAINGNLFMLVGHKLITPPVNEGCLNGILRKQILALAKKMEDMEVLEEVISPFDLQKADELFVTNVIKGIQPITKYRKKDYTTDFSNRLLGPLNALIRLG